MKKREGESIKIEIFEIKYTILYYWKKGCEFMEIKIMSQEDAQNWSQDQWMGVAVLVSITGSDTPPPSFYNNPRIIEKLSLSFDDVTVVEDNQTLLSESQCGQIKEFVLEHAEYVEAIVIHCLAGVSRGAAIAFAVCRLLELDDMWIWTSRCYRPNPYCVDKLNRILNLGLTESDIERRYQLLTMEKVV